MMRAAPGLLVLPVSPKARRLPSRKPGGLFCLQNSEFIMSHPSKPIDQADLVYGLEDRPPFGNALLSAITHLLAIFVPMITPALIVGRALELPVDMTAYLVSMAMVASGVGTWLQVNRFGPLGSGMLSIQSVNFSFVTVMIALGTSMKAEGLDAHAMISALLGVSFVGAFLVCFSAWLLPYLKKVITPTVSGVVVMLIGLSLVHVGITDFGGGFGAKADGSYTAFLPDERGKPVAVRKGDGIHFTGPGEKILTRHIIEQINP